MELINDLATLRSCIFCHSDGGDADTLKNKVTLNHFKISEKKLDFSLLLFCEPLANG